jgi:hypothetical protein
MMIEELLVEHLKDDGAVYALVGERIFAGRKVLNQEMPLIAYRRVSTLKTMTHDGPSLAGPRFDFFCWGENETQARQLRVAVSQAFDVATTPEFRSFVENELEQEFPPASLPVCVVDVRVWFDPAIEAEAS